MCIIETSSSSRKRHCACDEKSPMDLCERKLATWSTSLPCYYGRPSTIDHWSGIRHMRKPATKLKVKPSPRTGLHNIQTVRT